MHPIRNIDDLVTRYYIRLTVEDKVGTLAANARFFAEHGISISEIRQLEGSGDGNCTLVYVTHASCEGAAKAAISRAESPAHPRRPAP